jgi:NADP-dependent 3-hydroxy acid dehydrogenase YdfG
VTDATAAQSSTGFNAAAANVLSAEDQTSAPFLKYCGGALAARTSSPQVILITGASTGFGKACAELLADSSYSVYGTSRRKAEPPPSGYEMLQMDVTDDASVAASVATVLEREGRIDVLVNNAGVGMAGAIEDTSIEEARMLMDTNFLGVVRVTRAVIPGMREHRSGLVINMGSIAGWIAVPFQAFYSASKFALEGYSEALRMEVRPYGIRVAVIEPGDYHTNFTTNRVRARAADDRSAYRDRFEAAIASMEHSELNGPGPESVARLVKRLVEQKSPALRHSAGFVTQRVAVGLKRILPGRAMEAIVRANYKI